ncbi:Hypothetical_protein [Hexamita inflata]|uniref:Hypothetical_protein n=1 Tax=Hexamita inflata TaxID=28002 RepID=A0AA86UQW1_9EUKA|nr:Hypothetical protein HINF_LOCUS34998 [Hexamita inflata]
MHSQCGFIQHVCAYSLLTTTGQCQTSIQNSFMALLFTVSFSWSRPISSSSDSFRSTFSTSAGPLTSAPPVTNGESVSTRTLSIPIRLTAFLKFPLCFRRIRLHEKQQLKVWSSSSCFTSAEKPWMTSFMFLQWVVYVLVVGLVLHQEVVDELELVLLVGVNDHRQVQFQSEVELLLNELQLQAHYLFVIR